jgi:hypothetical protein
LDEFLNGLAENGAFLGRKGIQVRRGKGCDLRCTF